MDTAANIFPERSLQNSSPKWRETPLPATQPTMANFAAAGAASALASGLSNPLDCLRVRWQVESPSEKNIFDFAKKILREEGLMHGLWRPGLGANVIGMALASSLRFGYYETVRDSLSTEKDGWHMIMAGLICGAGAYVVTSPFHLMKTRIQAEASLAPSATSGAALSLSGRSLYGTQTNFMHRMVEVVKESGIPGLWRGSSALSARGALFTSGQMLGYDGMKTFARRRGFEDSWALHCCASVSASFAASFLSAPADFIMTRYMSSTSRVSLFQCIHKIYLDGGVVAFWRGWGVFFWRLAPVMLTYSTVYEQLRKQLGVGYMT